MVRHRKRDVGSLSWRPQLSFLRSFRALAGLALPAL